MKKIVILLLIVLAGYYSWKKFAKWEVGAKNKIEIKEIKKDSIEKPPFYLVNVLEKQDYDDAHIKGSIHVSMADLDAFLKKIEHNKEVPIIFYCTNYYCTSSDLAAQKAIRKGFEQVFIYKGGIAEWFQTNKLDKSYELEGECQMPYLQFVIIPETEGIDPLVDIIDEDFFEENQKIKIISINDLQKILKEATI